ncbi:uncharacterized protein LOC126885672 [Diabrotica virgifera virgifera]|uniref:Uncharacterized protein n=1 Tax=Diabrotica virgifera virgifera TaxID=50390 RepID=A0ABM5KDP7_DIAVI|nr:uncharacterized protein LOC126885672 [Diabrotica virgifera virgifera]
MLFSLQVLIQFLTLIFIFHYTRSNCLKSVSFNYWNIYSPLIRSYSVYISNVSVTEISKDQKLILTCVARNALCYQENIEILNQEDDRVVNINEIDKLLISLLKIYKKDRIQIYSKNFQTEYYKTLWSKAEFVQGYYYEKDKFLIHEWPKRRNALSAIYGAYAEESTLEVNTSLRYVTFRNKNEDYIFQLRVNLTKQFWLTDRGLLLLSKTNDSKISNSPINLSIEIFPKNELKKCNESSFSRKGRKYDGASIPENEFKISDQTSSPKNGSEENTETSQPFLIYIYVSIGVCLLGVVITLTYILCKCIRSKLTNLFSTNTTFIHIRRFRKRESSYVRFTEVNKYAVPNSNEQKVYDKLGKRVKLPNQEPNTSGHPNPRGVTKKKSTDLS